MARVRLKDIAAACGVSRATVSLVLQDSGRVSHGTKERVREAMHRMGYVYDRRAALRASRTMIVGLVTTHVRNPYFAELSMAIEGALYDQGYTLLLGYSRDDAAQQARLLEGMIEHRVDGLLIVPAYQTDRAALERTLAASATPHVLVARHVEGFDADYVGVDNVRAAELVGAHLAEQGYQRVAFLGGPAGSTARAEREYGLRKALEAHGRELDPALSIATSADRDGGAAAVQHLLAAGQVPDAVVCYSDVTAFGAMAALRSAGTIAVASFDDLPAAAQHQPPLTSVATFPAQTGLDAALLLQARIDDPALPSRSVLLTPRLHARESTLGPNERSTT
ncbi:LacI family DNA-binding transcriptional regulator [Amycolatopsis jejuensis]|uniref:LacI family DNA-binding transcriptional regulator n=1 Tax=Amycolatopsis jejuensis TaxID=330084 RepID=UPI000527BC8B|nr:LacI family DNA-binding transcriptional regulator [Amycolatopsis jejuensis]